MLFIKFEDGQGLGNQLWLFASAKSISEKLKLELYIEDLEKFKGKNFLMLKQNNLLIKNKNFLHKKRTVFNERLFYDNQLKYLASGFDERVLNIKKNTYLNGLFQSEKYFFGDLKKLKTYIKIKDSILKANKIANDICVLNIRGGEYKRHKKLLVPISYWEGAIKNFKTKFNIKKFIIVTDDYKYARSLFPNLEIVSGDIAKCYATIYNSKNIIVSNSSFSYFPCKTGFKKNVIAPMFWARPFNKYNRWMSPCNIYEDWLWQSEDSELKSYEECLNSAEENEKFYKESFFVLVDKRFIPATSRFRFIPKKIKILIKKFLAFFFPRQIG